MKKILLLLMMLGLLSSCQFSETLVLNEDGTGRMAISMDMSEMMAFGGASNDSTFTKQDTIIAFKDIFEERKDSIANLPKKEQEKLKAMEQYQAHIFSNPETQELVMDVFVDFKDISEANDLMQGFGQTTQFIPGSGSGNNSSEGSTEESEPQIIGVSYSFKKGKFKRDAFILDETLHKNQLDSLKQAESFMSGITYQIKYTFPRKIKKTNIEDATFSMDGKTMQFQRSFMEYFKNPDVLDVEVELER
ncbi:MAG TPA: hypothetical protein PKW08_06815 [Flavobacteriaceae bacterium]|nr:hypothetical protein [Flavobacteriaceae bacterium]MCB9212819.1 hypothetical protein [Alteromonas sp.]HPF12270.1 hypothetical protein [Flavobacteriaceae bacterium]HQU21282.1 hypothetical protein [Flavobacteriaceae bacterium]HQU66067.1 hypothetical protein [Flavobacteriaceae bacterium]